MSSDDTVLAALGVSIGLIMVCALVFWVLTIIAYWKMFTKAGEKGWKSIIPVYNTYVAFRLCWRDGVKNFWIFFAFAVVYIIAYALAGGDAGMESTISVASIIGLIAAIGMLIWWVRFLFKQAHAYNKGTGCAILSFFFQNILILYYGFASTAIYQGPQD